MKYFVGLDVSVKETSVCILNQDGGVIAGKSFLFEPEKIVYCLTPFYGA